MDRYDPPFQITDEIMNLTATIGGVLLPVVRARITSRSWNYAMIRRVLSAKGNVARTVRKCAVWNSMIMMSAYTLIQPLVA